MDKENDRRVYEYLHSAGLSYSKVVISAICEYLELSENKATEDAFLERIIATIREEITKSNPLGGLLQFVQQPVAQTPPTEKEDTENTEAMLDFIGSF